MSHQSRRRQVDGAGLSRSAVGSLPIEELQTMVEGIPEFVAVVSCGGTILLSNQLWDRELDARGSPDFRVGCSYPDSLAGLVEAGDLRAKPLLDAFQDISAGKRRTFQHAYLGSGVFKEHAYRMRLAAFNLADADYVLVSIRDTTELSTLKRQKRRFDSGVLKAQEGERRRMARELHDSTSQQLVALRLALANLDVGLGAEAHEMVSGLKGVIQEIQEEIRAFSYIAHPPSLERYGLSASVKTLAAGFGSRAGLKVELQVSEVGEASASIEAAIYRVAQEALSNIHRHASATQVVVRLVGRKNYIHLVISDDGIGFDKNNSGNGAPVGVGILGMEERVRELGGRFSVQRIAERTVVCASLARKKSDPAI